MAPLSRQGRLCIVLGALGFAITAVFFGYIELTNYSPMNLILGWASLFLCPASLLSVFLFDLNAHSVEITVAWALSGLVNSGIYAAVGVLIERFLRKRQGRPTG